jgi:hypothetical protein
MKDHLITVVSGAAADNHDTHSITESIIAAGFVQVHGAAHTKADRILLTETICRADIDYDDYAEYVKDGDRAAAVPIVEAVFGAGYGIPR